MGIGAALLIAALFKISVNGMVLNLKSLVFIMGINLVYGFAVPGIDNAGHIGGAITGLVIALAFAIGYRQRLAVALQNAAIQQRTFNSYQTNYSYNTQDNTPYNSQYSGQYSDQLNNQGHYDAEPNDQSPHLDANSSNQEIAYDDHDVNTPNMHRDTANRVTDIYPSLSNSAVHNTAIEPKALKKASIIWQLLPWMAMLFISIGFVWWWQDIHQQILQVLKAIE